MWILIYFLVIIVLYRKKSYVKALKFKEEYPSKLRKAGNELKNKIVSSAPSQFKAVASDLDWHEGICTREPGLYFEQEGTQEGVRLLLRAYLLRSIRTAVSLAGIKQMQTEMYKATHF